MAGFIYIPHKNVAPLGKIKDIISRQYLEIGEKFQLAEGNLYSFVSKWKTEKQVTAHYVSNQNSIYFFGHGLYRNKSIESCLEKILSRYLDGTLDESDFLGQYAIIYSTPKNTEVTVDESSFYKVYSDGEVLCTSFLLISRLQENLTWNLKSCRLFETFGYFNPLNSFFKEISCINGQKSKDIFSIRKTVKQYANYKLALDEHAHQLIAIYKGICRSGSPLLGLTGGLDSRLVLAILQAANINCRVFTKGNSNDIDLKIAQYIAHDLGLEFTNPQIKIEANDLDSFYYWDGPNHWGHQNAQEDLGIENWRAKQECEVLSGLGIGLYRDIWFHKDSGMNLRQLLQQRYHSNTLGEVRELVSDAEVFLNLAPDEVIARDDFDIFHFYYRCASLWGRRISIQGKHTNKYIPMLGQKMHNLSATIPIEWKYDAKFQRDLICHLEPRLASIRTSYNDTPQNPNKLSKVKEKIRRNIPIIIKRNVLQKARKPQTTNGLFSNQHKGSALLMLAKEFNMDQP